MKPPYKAVHKGIKNKQHLVQVYERVFFFYRPKCILSVKEGYMHMLQSAIQNEYNVSIENGVK